jgi:hypothetical protein
MGYRSDVLIAIAVKSKKDLLGFATEIRLGGDAEQIKALSEYKVTNGRVLFARFEGVKWYSAYPDVLSHMGILVKANEKGLPTCFICLGEEDDDIVVKFTNDDDYVLSDLFAFSRSIIGPTEGEPLLPTEEGKK